MVDAPCSKLLKKLALPLKIKQFCSVGFADVHVEGVFMSGYGVGLQRDTAQCEDEPLGWGHPTTATQLWVICLAATSQGPSTNKDCSCLCELCLPK